MSSHLGWSARAVLTTPAPSTTIMVSCVREIVLIMTLLYSSFRFCQAGCFRKFRKRLFERVMCAVPSPKQLANGTLSCRPIFFLTAMDETPPASLNTVRMVLEEQGANVRNELTQR